MAFFWRVAPRKSRFGALDFAQQKTAGAAGGYVGLDLLFGITGQITTGQGSNTSALTVGIQSGATATTGQGGFTSALACLPIGDCNIQSAQASFTSALLTDVRSDATIVSGQAQFTSDLTGAVYWLATMVSGQAGFTSDFGGTSVGMGVTIATTQAFTSSIAGNIPLGGPITTGQWLIDGRPLWRVAPRKLGTSSIWQLAIGGALTGIAQDAMFSGPNGVGGQTSDAVGNVTGQVAQIATAQASTSAAVGSVGGVDQTVSLTGFDLHAIGTAHVDFADRTLHPVGIAHGSMGALTIGRSTTQAAAIRGFGLADNVGNNTIVMRDGDQVVRFDGFAAGAIGHPSISGDTTGPGLTRYVYPDPIAQYGMGDLYVEPLTIYTDAANDISGGYAKDFGRAWISNQNRTIPISIGDTARFGLAWISHEIRTIDLKGFDHSVVWYYTSALGAHGEPASYVGHTTARTISPAGIDAGAFGGLTANRDTALSGFDAHAIGAPTVSGVSYIYPAGFTSYGMGASSPDPGGLLVSHA